MKKLWTIILATFGFGTSAFADCYSEAEKYMDERKEAELEFCLESDKSRLRVINKYYHNLSYEKQYDLSTEARKLMDRVGPDADIILANDICTVCHEGDDEVN